MPSSTQTAPTHALHSDLQSSLHSKTNFDNEADFPDQHESPHRLMINVRYLLAGIFLGIIFVKAEIISWYRIQEMFRFQSFHMYGVIGSAVVTAMISVLLIKKFKLKTIDGEPISFPTKKFHRGQVIGGLLFGFGWAMTGACPGPIFTLIGTGSLVFVVVLLSAIAGTWIYGYSKKKL